jgi:signal transduction histidine kinase
MDWCNADNDTVLEQEEIIAAIIDTAVKKIPQGEPVTITVYNEGERLQALTVLPS